jgi:hypothetical protein
MKRILILLLLCIGASVCHAQKENLQLNLTKGETYMQNMTSSVSIVQNLNGQEMKIGMVVAGLMSYEVKDITNSIYQMDVKYKSLTMSMTMPNGTKVAFSSEKNDETDLFSSVLGQMKDIAFQVTMTKSGRINEVTNVEALFNSVFAKFPQLSEAQKNQLRTQLMQAYGDKAFRGNLEMTSAIFPDAPVAKGEKWTIKTKLEAAMHCNLESVYELKEANDVFCVIAGETAISSVDKDLYVKANGMDVKYDLNGTMSSQIKVDRKSGWVIETKIAQLIKGTSHIKDNPQVPGGMIIPMSMTNDMVITGN